MQIFRRSRRLLPLEVPRLDGSSWPDRDAFGRSSFASSTYYELGRREAFEPEAHAVADLLVAGVLPRFDTGVSAEDEPYLRKLLTSAAQVGAGIGIVERQLAQSSESGTDPQIWAALWEARRALPAMPEEWEGVAAFLLQCGHYVARTEPEVLLLLLTDLPSSEGP